jgi:23S rRNA (uracil1939-C5)-methyltransferase
VKIVIDRLGHHGDGIAVGPEGPIFVSQMLPGEEVEGDLAGDRLINTRIVTPSDQRVRAPCAHAKTCGGCLMQHASDSFVAGWKVDIVRSALAGQGLQADFLPSITSPPRSRRRATISARRTKSGALLGFHARASDMLVAVPQCQLLHPDLVTSFPALEALVKIGGSRSGEVSLTITKSLGGLDVSVTGGKPIESGLAMELARVVEAFGLARLTWNGEGVALRTMPMQRFGRALVAPPPGAFLQATGEGEAALLTAVINAVGDARRIVDLFAGVGTFALPLTERAEVHAVEADAAMIGAMEKGWRQAESLRRLTVEARDLFRRPLEPDEFRGFDAVVIDPPRAGAEAQIATLAKSGVPVIASVSCNPITFARDAKVLTQAGYLMAAVQVVDQFRWSSHVEIVAKFERT